MGIVAGRAAGSTGARSFALFDASGIGTLRSSVERQNGQNWQNWHKRMDGARNTATTLGINTATAE